MFISVFSRCWYVVWVWFWCQLVYWTRIAPVRLCYLLAIPVCMLEHINFNFMPILPLYHIFRLSSIASICRKISCYHFICNMSPIHVILLFSVMPIVFSNSHSQIELISLDNDLSVTGPHKDCVHCCTGCRCIKCRCMIVSVWNLHFF